jgi:formylglycine-generating enzyme required for sulfatase activity
MTRPILACVAACLLAGLCAAPPEQGRAEAGEGDKALTNSLGMKLVVIPAGKFLMGSPVTEKERDPGEVQHEVEITRPFYMGAYEVTQAQYEKVWPKPGAGGRARFGPGSGGGPDHPMENIFWHRAVEFCNRLSARPEEREAKRRYRLPTEAEWEYACRAGTTTPFHYGESLSSALANFNGNFPYGGAAKGPYLRKTAKVGSYKPNAWGLYDMHGNVAEWCSDYYDPNYYKNSPRADPKGPAKGVLPTDYKDFYRVIRGGCWLDEARGCRSAYRYRAMPHDAYQLIGFRVVCEVAAKGR